MTLRENEPIGTTEQLKGLGDKVKNADFNLSGVYCCTDIVPKCTMWSQVGLQELKFEQMFQTSTEAKQNNIESAFSDCLDVLFSIQLLATESVQGL